MKNAPILLFFIAVLGCDPPASEVDNPCSEAFMELIRAEAAEGEDAVKVDCDIVLRSDDVITKRLIYEGSRASDLTLIGNGAILNGGPGSFNHKRHFMIEIRSREEDGRFDPPSGILIQDVKVKGGTRIWGLGRTGEGGGRGHNFMLESSSSRSDHTAYARESAPRDITFEKVELEADFVIPLYLAPGVTNFTLRDSELNGEAASVALYLDAESGNNLFENNYIHTTGPRELIAVDGSSNNRFFGNRLSALNGGGIYLYRNCGEGGVSRHNPPVDNQFINNVFFYRSYSGDKPAIYIGSRNGNRNYCPDDANSTFGSGVDDRDFASRNVILQNQFYNRPTGLFGNGTATLSDHIRNGNPAINVDNLISDNELVNESVDRPTGCHLPNGYKPLFPSGEMIDVTLNSTGHPICNSDRFTCSNGQLVAMPANLPCEIIEVPFQCQVTANNDGCSGRAQCPTGTKVVGAKAACNLEFGSVSGTDLSNTRGNQLNVVRASDNISDGTCLLGSQSIKSEQAVISDHQDADDIFYGCSERDANGGDCHISGVLYCR